MESKISKQVMCNNEYAQPDPPVVVEVTFTEKVISLLRRSKEFIENPQNGCEFTLIPFPADAAFLLDRRFEQSEFPINMEYMKVDRDGFYYLGQHKHNDIEIESQQFLWHEFLPPKKGRGVAALLGSDWSN